MSLTKNSLQKAIAELGNTILELNKDKKVDVDSLVEATNDSFNLISRIYDLADATDNMHKSLPPFLKTMLQAVKQLQQIAKDEQTAPPPPDVFYQNLISAFDKLLVKTGQQESWPTLKKSVKKSVPNTIRNTIYCCENVPEFWSETTRVQKVGLMLGMTLLLTSVGITLALCFAPAVGVATAMTLGVSAVMLTRLGTMFCRFILDGPKRKTQDREKVNKALQNLENQEQSLNELVYRVCPEIKYEKQGSVVFKQIQKLNSKKITEQPTPIIRRSADRANNLSKDRT